MIPIIQNRDRNVSARDFRDLDGLLVTTVFRTLQGEGPYSGWPAIFLRLSGCNYGSKTDMCSWCDTAFQFDQGNLKSVDDVLADLLAQPGYNPKDILVITGGEPTLQIKLLELIVKARAYFKVIQIETNGTQPKFFEEAEDRGMVSYFKTVISPKANMRLGSYPPLHPKVSWYADCLKFVISADPESAHHTIPAWAFDMAERGRTVYVSPMTVYLKDYPGEVSSIWDAELVDQKQTAANYAYAAQFALSHNLKLSLQTHTFTSIP